VTVPAPDVLAEPFDRSLPSPIGPVLELRASARGAVVVAGELTATQERSLIETGLEARILEVATGDAAPALIVVSGSAGGGKSAAIHQLAGSGAGVFAAVVEDATHAESPDQEQYERLVGFFSPLADGKPRYAGKPLLIAMNTGMAIRFFDQLRRERGDEHGFTALEAELREQLELPERPSDAALPGEVLIVNLDLRATTGGPDSLFQKMLAAFDPARDDGILNGAARCATCTVRDYCFVRTNAEIVSAEPARAVLAAAADELALTRGRLLQPRELWDLAADTVTGGAPFGAGDPCDEIAALQRAEDRVTVWQRLAANGAFVEPYGELGKKLADLDPSYQPGDLVHTLLTRTGIDCVADGNELVRLLGREGEREAVVTAAAALAHGEVTTDSGAYDRIGAGRGLVRAATLAGEVALAPVDAALFRAALVEYAEPGVGDKHLEDLQGLVADALVAAFGVEVGVETFFFTRAYDPRRHAILAGADLLNEDLLRLPDEDPVREASPKGAEIAGYRPLAVMFELAGVPLRVDLPLFRLLALTRAGTKPSSADLERFFHLRRAAEALGRKIAADASRPLLITERDSGRRFRLAERRIRGTAVLGVTEVV
jgi:hypothetical protein